MAPAGRKQLGNATFRGVRIIFRNFKGKGDKFNKEGERNFGIIIPDLGIAETMRNDGWDVKYLKPREEERSEAESEGSDLPTDTPWIKAKVAYDKGRPPKIYLVTSRGRRLLNERTVAELDASDITNVDVIISPYWWEFNGRSGYAAYVKTMMVTIEEDELEAEYSERFDDFEANTPDADHHPVPDF